MKRIIAIFAAALVCASVSAQEYDVPGEGFMGDSIRLSSDNSSLTFTTAYDKHFTRIEIRGTNKNRLEG